MRYLNIIKFQIFIIMIIVLYGCRTEVIEINNDKYPLNEKVRILFSGDVKIIDYINKNETQISGFNLKKSNNQKDTLLKLLMHDGWTYKGSGNGVETYCLGNNNKINFITPHLNKVSDYLGNVYEISEVDDIYSSLVGYRYYQWGDDACS